MRNWIARILGAALAIVLGVAISRCAEKQKPPEKSATVELSKEDALTLLRLQMTLEQRKALFDDAQATLNDFALGLYDKFNLKSDEYRIEVNKGRFTLVKKEPQAPTPKAQPQQVPGTGP